jgi:hypothetical protein
VGLLARIESPMRLARVALALLCALLAVDARGELRAAPPQRPSRSPAEDAAAAPVTEQSALENERFWPYHVSLVRDWQPPGGLPALPRGSLGVLIRVEASATARIDFGRDGVQRVPIAATDLVAQANLARTGARPKLAPNFVLAIGPRLVDAASPSIRPLGLRAASEPELFLCVFADPQADGFAELARALRPLADRPGVSAVVFPQGDHPDLDVRERLRALGWPMPFVYDPFAEPYTRSLLDEGTPLPAITLQTREGRLLFEATFEPDVLPALSSVLERAFGPKTATSRDPSPAPPGAPR